MTTPSERDREEARALLANRHGDAPWIREEMLALALATARAEGRREGMEEAAQILDARARAKLGVGVAVTSSTIEDCAAAIRARAEGGGPESPG